MIRLATWVLWIHLLSAAAWLGGGITLLAAILPFKGEARAAMGRRTHFLTSRAMEILVITGILNILLHGRETGLIYSAPYFGMLSVKMGLLVVMAALQLWLGAAWKRDGEEAVRRARVAVPIQLALGAVAALLGMGIRTV